jgi:hypothetical protein
MVSRVKIFRTLIAAPVLCLGMLGVVAVDASRQQPPPEVDAYHAKVKTVIESVPFFMGANNEWVGKEEQVPEAAQKLLKPNAIISRRYVDNSSNDGQTAPRSGHLLLEQCRDSSDMDGHWPPNCYPNKGEKLVFEAPRKWTVGGHPVRLTEYHFAQVTADGTYLRCVYNFLIVPGSGTTRDMDDVRTATTDYRQRYYGSAQVQVIVDGDLPKTEREQIFMDLVSPLSNAITAINAINSGGPQ